MYIQIEEPTETISADAVKMWRISNSVGHGIVFLIIGVLIVCTEILNWYGWIGVVLYIIGGITILSAIYSILIEPVFLQKTWRYKIDPQFIQLKHGKWQTQHTLIPMEKVEYVRTEQGPIMRHYQLYKIEIGTTTSSHVIPAIASEQAKRLQAEIAIYAKIQDSQVGGGERA
ncbi:PH domain-containing protein [Neobacillus sp. MER 74]|uniref:PH domain-containing protein n=1 Tax=Neobacillus sp. MER 74 TaxID=2939566 RepID=UPI00203E65C9|nr:PH domain-containing protein [Neobacillus sp. MER 74]MCM3117413.1 PH domain-containing protein [Neobacillus sp. MER 74]